MNDLTAKLESGTRMHAEIPARWESHRAWIGVYPFKGSPYGPRPRDGELLPWRFRIRKFEVNRKLIEGNYDVHEEHLEEQEDWIVESAGDVLTRLFPRWPELRLVDHLPDYPI